MFAGLATRPSDAGAAVGIDCVDVATHRFRRRLRRGDHAWRRANLDATWPTYYWCSRNSAVPLAPAQCWHRQWQPGGGQYPHGAASSCYYPPRATATRQAFCMRLPSPCNMPAVLVATRFLHTAGCELRTHHWRHGPAHGRICSVSCHSPTSLVRVACSALEVRLKPRSRLP